MPHPIGTDFQPPFSGRGQNGSGRQQQECQGECLSGGLPIGAATAATALLLAPAIWNRFPLLQYDTGGYLARWFEGYLVPSRSSAYGLFLVVFAQPNFWLVVIAQAAITAWLLALTLRTHGFGGRPWALPLLTALLCVGTTLPWLTSILLTDIFVGLAVLALHLLVFAHDLLRRYERAALVGLIGFAVATHSATFAVVLALVLATILSRALLRLGHAGGIARGAAALLLGALLLLSANFVTAGRFTWTPGGIALSFGRMLQDGIVARYLAEHCPDRRLRLCAHRAELPTNADVFFWGGEGTVFNRLGRFAGLGDEMTTIVVESLREYPGWQAKLALVATMRQLMRVETGEGVVNSAWHSYAIMQKFTPSVVADMRAAHQQRGEFNFDIINRLHVPIAFTAMLALLAIVVAGFRHPAFADLGLLATTAATSLLANAVVCGVFANPHDRYGARLIWIAPLVTLLAIGRAVVTAQAGRRLPRHPQAAMAEADSAAR
jgi:hypothetical protein